MRPAHLLFLLAACGNSDPTSGTDATAPRGPAPEVASEAPRLRKLTASEYLHTLDDLFGEGLVLPTRLEPDETRNGLLAVGARQQAVSPLGIERYEDAAFLIAEQVMADPTVRDRVLTCTPTEPACSATFAADFGKLVWRRPLTDVEIERLVSIAAEATSVLGDPTDGMAFQLAAMLQSPHFLYRVELDSQGQLDSYAQATKLAYFLWAGPPDAAMLSAADQGEFLTENGWVAQVDRALADPKARRGVRALFDDVLELYALRSLSKDPTVFLHYSDGLGDSAREETLRTVEAVVFDDSGSYLDLFTTRNTYVDRSLAAIYEVQAPERDGFGPIEIPLASGRRGILGHVSFLAGQAHAVSTSVTLRGLYIQSRLLCRDIPPPPANVDTSIPEADADAPTMRLRIATHLEDPVCAGCHTITDPTGLSFETFDGIGRPRVYENGVVIDPSGDLDGVPFSDAATLADVLIENPDLPFCFTQTAMAYANGHRPDLTDEPLLDWHTVGFTNSDHAVLSLLRDLATADAFRMTAPQTEESP